MGSAHAAPAPATMRARHATDPGTASHHGARRTRRPVRRRSNATAANSSAIPAPATTGIRVFLVDDQELVRAGVRMVIDAQPDMEIFGEAGNGAEAVERLAVTRADVVLMDVRMPRMDGVAATRLVRSRPDPPRVVLLTTFDLDEYAFTGLKAGASGFLLKDAPPPDLLAAVRAVHAGDAVVAPSTTRRLIEQFAPYLPSGGPGVEEQVAGLTAREREVLLAVAGGLSNAEIAGRLSVSEATVKTHVGRILAKLELRDRVQLVVFAYEHGLARPGGTGNEPARG